MNVKTTSRIHKGVLEKLWHSYVTKLAALTYNIKTENLIVLLYRTMLCLLLLTSLNNLKIIQEQQSKLEVDTPFLFQLQK